MKRIRHFILVSLCLLLLAFGADELLPKASAASAMTASNSCIEFIKEVEGFSAKPYFDYAQYTIGYGTECPDDKYAYYNANGITKAEASVLLQEEVASVADTLNKKLIDQYGLSFTQHQFDALVSFSFNIGTGWVTYDSTLRNAILRNASDSDFVYAFGLYCTAGGKYLPGLVTRRLSEANMYLNGVYSKQISDTYGYVYYDANGGTLTYRVQGYMNNNNTAPAADAVRTGDVFLGWYTELNGGSKVTVLTKDLKGKTLFARWQSSENGENQDSTSVTVKLTGDVVNVRNGPGLNYGVVKQLRKSETVTVTHVTHLTDMRWGKIQSGWICLDYTNYDDVVNGSGSANTGSTGSSNQVSGPDTWGSADSVWDDTPISTPTPTPSVSQTAISGTVRVNDFLKIRSGPGTNYATVGFLFNNNTVQILEQKTVGTSVWGRIADGWVCMDYIVIGTSSTGSATGSTTGSSSGSGTAQDWDGNSGSTSSSNTESVSIRGTITADALRIRSAAGTASSIVGFYYRNDTVTITQKTQIGTTYWGKTSKGWISMDYVTTDASSADSSQSASSGTKTVIADCLRIRKEAGTDQKITGFLYYGDKTTVTETKTVNGMLWGRVSQGWISMNYVK